MTAYNSLVNSPFIFLNLVLVFSANTTNSKERQSRATAPLENMSLYSDEMCLLSGPSSTAHGTSSSGVRQRTSTPRSIYPLTKSQEGMWVEFQADRSSTKYNLTLEWDLLRNRSGSVPSIADILNGNKPPRCNQP